MIYSIVDVLLGGRRGTVPMRIEGRPYTTIEARLIERLIRLILDPADEHQSRANQMRQWFSFQKHSRRGNARDKQVPVLIVARAGGQLKPRLRSRAARRR